MRTTLRFRYFDPLEQATVEGDLVEGLQVGELVGRLTALRADCVPALELAGGDGSSLVLGVSERRAAVLWTSAEGTSSHSVGGGAADPLSFDFFGALTQVPGHFGVPLETALVAVGGYADTGATPSLPLARD